MSAKLCWRTALALVAPAAVSAQVGPGTSPTTSVGPPRGTVIVVGGGAMGPEVYAAFIKAAGGPDALIIDVPTAGGAATYGQDDPSARSWRNAGARNVVVLHTTDKKLADSDSFAAALRTASGVWFEGGRQFHLVDSYAGTKTEQAFHDVLARGGVVGGSSAGATILGDFLVRGAPSNDNTIMDDPRYEKGFAFLRGVGIDQHVVARERLADLADSIIPKYPRLLGISEDEGTAWVVRGDTATIVGRNKAFIYGTALHDPRKPFLTLHPGDAYNLASRVIIRRAVAGSPLTEGFVDGLFTKYAGAAAGGATVLVAREGKVLVNKSYGIPDQPKYMPTTTVPQFAVGGITAVFTAICTQVPPPPPARGAGSGSDSPLQGCIARRVSTPIGMHKTVATADGQIHSSVDELYRLALGLEHPETFTRTAADSGATAFNPAPGWQADSYRGTARYSAFSGANGRRGAFVRIPAWQVTVIILTNDAAFDAEGTAGRILDRLLPIPGD